jgi:hypothetical protein
LNPFWSQSQIVARATGAGLVYLLAMKAEEQEMAKRMGAPAFGVPGVGHIPAQYWKAK